MDDIGFLVLKREREREKYCLFGRQPRKDTQSLFLGIR